MQPRRPPLRPSIRNSADFESEVEEAPIEFIPRLPSILQPVNYIPSYPKHALQALETLTWEEKREKVAKKLRQRFGSTYELQYSPYESHNDPSGIHVFVDSSNITIGWLDMLRSVRGFRRDQQFQLPPLSWKLLALVMERGRSVARRVIVVSGHYA